MWAVSLATNVASCCFRDLKPPISCLPSIRATCSAANQNHEYGVARSVTSPVLSFNGLKERIREQLTKVELSTSPYDTAWVAMVPSQESSQKPCFPECLEWILDNQNPDGSWCSAHVHPPLIKDALTSTLACILALTKWNISQEHVMRGLDYIGNNFHMSMDDQLPSPVGFDIIFPSMMGYAINIGLDLHVAEKDLKLMLCKRAMELESVRGSNSEGRKAYLAYVAEGLGETQNWQEIMKYQKKNGSLFNSPSATAAALEHLYDAKALQYLHSTLQKFGGSVPAVYPLDTYYHLCMVDNVERLGIARHFTHEIKTVLDKIYSSWLYNDEETRSDTATCSMAFRLLRMHGYDISSGALAQFIEPNYNSAEWCSKNVNAVLELHKASEIKISANEQVLDKIGFWSSNFLKAMITTKPKDISRFALEEVDYVLKFPLHANLDRLEHKRHIEHFKAEDFCVLKILNKFATISSTDVLKLAVKEFQSCQAMYREELQNLDNWVKESKLDQLEFARQKQTYCYFSAAATLFSPELTDARMCWAKNGVLTTVVDDFFDIGGSKEEQENLISLIERWTGNHESEYCSDQVRIIYSALYSTINELSVKACKLQKRTVTDHIVEIWLNLVKSMMKEAEWLRTKKVPTLDKYMENGYVSFALGPIILPALYFIGPEVTEDMVRHPEYENLYKLVSTCGRLINDTQTFQRECQEGKMNSVSLRILHGGGSVSEEEAKRENERVIDSSRIELLRLVLKTGSVVPSPCKDLFWNMCRILHFFYMKTDGFTSQREMLGAVSSVIFEPLRMKQKLESY